MADLLHRCGGVQGLTDATDAHSYFLIPILLKYMVHYISHLHSLHERQLILFLSFSFRILFLSVASPLQKTPNRQHIPTCGRTIFALTQPRRWSRGWKSWQTLHLCRQSQSKGLCQCCHFVRGKKLFCQWVWMEEKQNLLLKLVKSLINQFGAHMWHFPRQLEV